MDISLLNLLWHGILRLDVTQLNTMQDPKPGYRDESPKVRCPACGHTFLLGRGMREESPWVDITKKHLELCEGDAAVTLMKIEQWYRLETSQAS